jgi:hypothetical protein
VGLVPPGYAKLAFDPQRFTQASQAERRAAQAEAWSGDLARLTAVADRFDVQRIAIPRDGERWALLDVAAAGLALADGGAAPGAVIREGNGWDAVELAPGQRLVLPPGVSGPVTVGVRVLAPADGAEPAGFKVLAQAPDGSLRDLTTLTTTAHDDWARGTAAVNLPSGDRLVLEAVTPATIQAVSGWVDREPVPAGWQIALDTAEATVLERAP